MNKKKIKPSSIVLFLVCCAVAVAMIMPFLWMVSASFKLRNEIFSRPIQWIPQTFHKDNYETILEKIPFSRYFFNTAKITIIITLLQLVTCSMAAYAFSKLHFPGRDTIFLCYLGTMMVPWHAIMIPQFIVIQKLHLYDNHLSLILTGAFSAFGVFLLRQNMLSIPDSLNEAAKIDGCDPVGIYWNDYMGPMIYLDKDVNRTIQLGLATFKREFDTNYGAIMAGTVISLIPVVIIYVTMQKYIVEGIAYSGVKG